MAAIDLSTFNNAQRDVVQRLDEPLFVAAGAGSGKTFTLTARLVHALSKGSGEDGGRFLSSIDEALVITFTKAAAAEIKERVRGALRKAGKDDPVLREESLKVDGAWISTIHGMCVRILRRHGIELGIDPAFSVCEGSVAEALLARAFDEVLSAAQQDPACERLLDTYRLGSSGQDDAYSVAGMIGRMRAEAAKCVHGFDDLRCPQSNETVRELARVLHALEALDAQDLTPKQREKIVAGLELVRGFGALPPNEQTAERAVACLQQVKIPDIRKAAVKPFKDELAQVLAEAADVACHEDVQEFAPLLVALARQVEERYGQLKRERSYLDNDDLIARALEAVERHPEVSADYAGRFRLVMIDEFQDTDARQLQLISLLAGEDACHLTTVGDAQQAIYRFRGGDVAVFRERGASLPQESHVEMDVNYRSDHHVLAAVERICGDSEMLPDFLKLAANAHRLERRNPDGSVTVEKRFETHRADGTWTPRLVLEVTDGGRADEMAATQAAQLADRLAAYHAAGQPMRSMALLLGTTGRIGCYLDALRAHGLKAVVTGGSSFSSTREVGVIQALLHTLANPHDTETGLFRLLSSDLFCLDADDFCELGTRTQELFEAPAKRAIEQYFLTATESGEPPALFGAAQPSARLAAAYGVLRRAFARLSSWQLADVCQAVLEESGWLYRLEAQGTDGLNCAANVLAAVRYVRELTTSLGLGTARAANEFDQWLAAAKLTPKLLVGEEVDAVKVMTIHGSKGLQFGVTAVAECWGNPKIKGRLLFVRAEGCCMACTTPQPPKLTASAAAALKEFLPPASPKECQTVADWARYAKAMEQREQWEEKCRLLYVALTRAEEALIVGVPLSTRNNDQSMLAQKVLSAFEELDELAPGERAIDSEPARPVQLEYRKADADGVTKIWREDAPVEEGLARVVQLTMGEHADDPLTACSSGTLVGFDGLLPQIPSQIALVGATGRVEDEKNESTMSGFVQYHAEEPALRSVAWRPRAGVFSYSSAHALMEEQADAGEPVPDTSQQRLPRKAQDAEVEGASYTDDDDKATNLGSAFHELAQTMVETQADHRPERLEALARTWNLSARATVRLREAIARWEGSVLRREAWTHEVVRAEVPFFVQVDSRFGDYVEGAIDLLATDAGSTEALVIDYKTGDRGLSIEQIEARHRMQANFYAWVLMNQGFVRVECAFCCVEVDDGAGGPQVVRYRFDEGQLPRIG